MPKVFCPPQHPNPSAGSLDSPSNPALAPFSNVPPAPSSLYGLCTLSLTPYPQVRQIRHTPATAGQGLDLLGRPAMESNFMPMPDLMPTFSVPFQDQYNSAHIQPLYDVNPPAYHSPAAAGFPSSMPSAYPSISTTQLSSSSPMFAGESIGGPIFPFAG